MQIKLYTVPINNIDDFNEEINSFLRGHKIIEIEKQLITLKDNGYWCITITYIHAPQYEQKQKEKIDYLKILNDQDFTKFSKLREWRKEKAIQEKIAPYIIFTDAELAEIAKLPELNMNTLPQVATN